MKRLFSVAFLCLLFIQCKQKVTDDRIVQLDPKKAASIADSIKGTVSAQIDSGLTLTLWGIDSLVADPVSLDVDDLGRIYYTRTNRQKHSEFDIRGHQDWEIASIRLSTVEEKRAFLHKTLSPENSEKNKWLADLNGDGSHDWRDMTVEKEHVYRIVDSDGDGIADRSQLVVEDFNEEVTDAAGGVLKHGKDLFVGIGPDLWRIKEGKNGTMESKKSISHGYGIHVGFSGHGMSGIEVGPEGKIYWQIGDIGFNGVSPDGKKWEHPNSGVILRSNPDGSDFEVFAYGNRNTHEFVFDEYGNMISEDNDGDHPGESERIVHVVEGADIGWRTNWQFGKYLDPDNNKYKVWMDEKMYVPRFEGQPAYILPPIQNFVNGPTGMVYNPGTALGNEYKNQFFVAEFVGNPTQSGIHAFRLRPKGSSFEFAGSKMIVKGILATGMDWGPDGSLYFGDWINGWGTKDYGRIWKMDVKSPDAAQRDDTKKWLSADLDRIEPASIGTLLQHSDMRVRQKAQFALAEKGDAGLSIFKLTLNKTENQLARIHAIWGISQFARKTASHAAILIPLLKDKDPEIRAQAARWLGDVRYKQAGPELLPLLKDEYSRARFFAAEALGRIAYAPAIEPIIEMLEVNNDEDHYLRHAGSLALARIGNAKPIIALSGNASRAVRMAAVLALRRMREPGIAVYLNDVDEKIATEASRAINDDLSITEALPALAGSLTTSPFSNEAFLRRAINANLRVGTNDCLERLIKYAGTASAPVAMRAEAIATLGTWAKPSVLDRVDGRFRGEISRDAVPAREKAAKTLIELFKNNEVSLRLEAAKACGKLNISGANNSLLAMLQKDPNSGVREEALKAICTIKGSDAEIAIKTALGDPDKKVRMSGLSLIGQLPISKEVMAEQLAQVIQKGSVEEKQTALATLSIVPFSYSRKLLEELIGQMENGKVPADIQLELSEAIDSTHDKTLKGRWRSLAGAKNSDSTLSSYAAVLYGGDPEKGAGVFWGHPTAQCLRCHSYNDQGGTAGPRLNGIGNRLTREQLLQALVQPSARIAPGYGQASIVLKDNKKIIGILMEEDAKNYRIQRSEKKDTLIEKAQVASFRMGPSSMPPMHTILTKKEMRDLISFLATRKEN